VATLSESGNRTSTPNEACALKLFQRIERFERFKGAAETG